MVAGLFALVLVSSTAFGQTTGTNGVPPRERLQLQQRLEKLRNAERPGLPADVKEMLKQAQEAQKAFREQQADLAKKLKDATQEERTALRDAIKASRDQFRDEQRERAKDVMARLKEIQNNSANDITKPTAGAGEQGSKGRGR